jgi:hypothetical protein
MYAVSKNQFVKYISDKVITRFACTEIPIVETPTDKENINPDTGLDPMQRTRLTSSASLRGARKIG